MREEDFDYQHEFEQAKMMRREKAGRAGRYGSAVLAGAVFGAAAILGTGVGQNHFFPRCYVIGEREIDGEKKVAVEVPFFDYEGHSRLAFIDPSNVPSGTDNFRVPSWNLNYSGLLMPGNTHVIYNSEFGDFNGDGRIDLRLTHVCDGKEKEYDSIDFRGKK